MLQAKSLNVDVWTVTIGPSVASELPSCATTTSQALYTNDGRRLATTFSTIAKQVAMLRITCEQDEADACTSRRELAQQWASLLMKDMPGPETLLPDVRKPRAS